MAAQEGQFQFPVLQRVLITYFPGPGREEDHSAEFIARYQKYGEETIEFRGIKAELESAVNHHPMVAALEVNFALGTELGESEVRNHLISLHDQIDEVGAFDTRQNRGERLRGGELLRSYFLVPIRVPGWLRKLRLPERVPIGFIFLGGLALLIASTLLFRVVPSVLRPVANAFTFIGLVTVGLSAFAMFTLRREVLREEPDDGPGPSASANVRRSRWASWTRFRT
jgi:hypothetical protein